MMKKEMTKKEKIKYIMVVVKQQVGLAEVDYVESEAKLASAKTGHRVWEENDDYGGGFGSRNPYHPESAKERRDEKLEHLNDTKAVLDFATETFLSMIPEDE